MGRAGEDWWAIGARAMAMGDLMGDGRRVVRCARARALILLPGGPDKGWVVGVGGLAVNGDAMMTMSIVIVVVVKSAQWAAQSNDHDVCSASGRQQMAAPAAKSRKTARWMSA